jgi:hypothetical protein
LYGEMTETADADNSHHVARPGAAVPQCRSALNVVTPAHRSGADSTEFNAAGIFASAEASASIWVA